MDTLIQKNYKSFLILTFFVLIALLPDTVFALETAAQTTKTLLDNVIDFLTGTLARSLAIIALILIGLGALFGFWDIRKAGFWAIGIILIFSAAWIVDQVAPVST